WNGRRRAGARRRFLKSTARNGFRPPTPGGKFSPRRASSSPGCSRLSASNGRSQRPTVHMAASRRRSAFGFSTKMRAAILAARAGAPGGGGGRGSGVGGARRGRQGGGGWGGPRELCGNHHARVLAEPITQPLRLATPHLDEARPQRLDDVDLVAVDHDALAQ